MCDILSVHHNVYQILHFLDSESDPQPSSAPDPESDPDSPSSDPNASPSDPNASPSDTPEQEGGVIDGVAEEASAGTLIFPCKIGPISVSACLAVKDINWLPSVCQRYLCTTR